MYIHVMLCINVYTYTHKILFLKNKEILPLGIMWIDSEGIMLTEISQRDTNTYMWDLQIQNTSEYNKKEKDSPVQRTN